MGMAAPVVAALVTGSSREAELSERYGGSSDGPNAADPVYSAIGRVSLSAYTRPYTHTHAHTHAQAHAHARARRSPQECLPWLTLYIPFACTHPPILKGPFFEHKRPQLPQCATSGQALMVVGLCLIHTAGLLLGRW